MELECYYCGMWFWINYPMVPIPSAIDHATKQIVNVCPQCIEEH